MADYRQSWFFYYNQPFWASYGSLPMFYGGYYYNPVLYGFLDEPTSYTLDDLGFILGGVSHEWSYQKTATPMYLRRGNCDTFDDGDVENNWTITNADDSRIQEYWNVDPGPLPLWNYDMHFVVAPNFGGGVSYSPAVGHAPMSTGIMWNDVFTHGEMIRDLNNNDTEFWVAARLCPRGGEAAGGSKSIFNSSNYYTSGLFLFPNHDGGWGVNKRYNRIEIGIGYDSSLGGSKVGIWFAAVCWDPDAGDERDDYNFEEVLDTTDGPIEVMIQRRNISGVTADWYVYYRVHGSVGGPNDWGAWQEADDAGVKGIIADWGTEWTDPGRLDQSESCICGSFAWVDTNALDEEKALFGRFQYGLNPSDPAANQLYLEDHLASEEIEFKEVLTGTENSLWDMSTFDHRISNFSTINWMGIEASAKNDLVQFAYDIDNDNTPSYSAFKTVAQMQAESDVRGKYFHLKAKLIDGAGASTPYGGVFYPGTGYTEGNSVAFDFDASTTPEFGIATCIFSYGPDFTFEGSPRSGDPPLAVDFWPTIISDDTYVSLWDFGDLDSGALNYSTESSPSHTYNNYGVYSVALTCRDPNTWTTVTYSDYITVPEEQVTYAVDFEGSPTSGYAPLNVGFTEKDSTKITKEWSWNFGDGQTSARANPLHTYSEAGTYTVAFTGTSVDNDFDTETKSNYVTVSDEGSPGPRPNFYYESSPVDSRGGISPYHVHFFDTSSNSPDAWSWDFDGDGVEDSSAQNPSYTYNSSGTYSVTLGVSRDGGVVNEFTWINLINVESSWAPSVSDPNAYGFKVWHLPSSDRYIEGGRVLISDSAVKAFSTSYLARGGLGGARLLLAKEWADRAEEAIEIGDPIALMKKKTSTYSEESDDLGVWYYGYVTEIASNAESDEVTYILEGPMGRLAGIYPGGNSDEDHVIHYGTTLTAGYDIDPNDPSHWALSWNLDKNNIEDIVKDLFDRYLATLTYTENPFTFIFGPRSGDTARRFYSEATAASTDISYLRLDGQQSFCELMDQFCILAGDYVWGVDVRCNHSGSPESVIFVEPVFFFRKRSMDAGYPATLRFEMGNRDYPLTGITETNSTKFLYNELAIEGAYLYVGLPYVVPYAKTYRHAGSIARYGKRRISMCLPPAKTHSQAQQYIAAFFAKYAFPHKFYSVTQVGSTERIQPWRMEYYVNADLDWMPEGGHVMLKDENGGIVGVYEFDESTLNILGPTSVWTVELGPRDPNLKSGVSTLDTKFKGVLSAGGISEKKTDQPRKTQESITQDDYETPYIPVHLGFARITEAQYDPDLKDYLYTIVPTKDPQMNPIENTNPIENVYNINSVLIVPDITYAYSARALVVGTQVAYFRGWNPRTRQSYYYLNENNPRLALFDVVFGTGTSIIHSKIVTFPPESCLYYPLKEHQSAPAVHLVIDSELGKAWTLWIDWDYATPAMIIRGRTNDGLPAFQYFPVHCWVLGVIKKRSDI